MQHASLLVNRALLTLLGVSTGAVKLARMPEEMELFAQAGFSTGATVAFGVIQLLAALALLDRRSARGGARVLLLSFIAATIVLFVNGMLPFGLVSLLFIAMAALAAARPEVGAVFPLQRNAQSSRPT